MLAAQCYLVWVLSQPQFTADKVAAIVFTSTCRGALSQITCVIVFQVLVAIVVAGAEVISEMLLEMKVDCVSLHSRKNQARRLAALGKFRSGRAKVLVATDVASRGLDIPTVQVVINYDVPRTTEDYLHRVGRTARAGRGGELARCWPACCFSDRP
jgi:superfamily II DNA/RNA helicase